MVIFDTYNALTADVVTGGVSQMALIILRPRRFAFHVEVT
jgi:hypothetical protein